MADKEVKIVLKPIGSLGIEADEICRSESSSKENWLKAVGLYSLKKMKEFCGLRLTFVQKIYWCAVQRRIVMGQLESLAERGKIKDSIPYELAEALMKGDEAMKKSLIHLCEKGDILVKVSSKGDSVSPDRLLNDNEMDEADTGDIEDRRIDIKDVCNQIPEVEDEHEHLQDKGGFWDLAFIAMKFLRSKYTERANDRNSQEGVSFIDDESIEETDYFSSDEETYSFFGEDKKRKLNSSDDAESTDDAESIDGFHTEARTGLLRKAKRSLYRLSQRNNHRPSYWQYVNNIVPLRVSNFRYRYVHEDMQAKLNMMWKKAARWPLFTYWVTFVQIIIMVLSLSVYGFAPLRYTPYTERALVQHADLSVRVAERNITPNIWAGPNRAALVLLGANYGPCMRRDRSLQEVIGDQQEQEAENSGCCVRRDSSGCVQVQSDDDCPNEVRLADFVTVDPAVNYSRFSNRTVCGTSPRTCRSPDPDMDSRWSSSRISGWPICTQSVSSNASHLSCRVTGHPCCFGLLSQCVITSQEHCDFLEGYFHEDAFLCSQVSCLKDICGLTPFGDVPDQIQRLGLALFLHAGLFHLLMTVVFNMYVLRDLEKYLGWLATASLYIGSGIGGNIVSALFVPYSAEVGPAASVFGVISFFLVFITYHWNFFSRADREMLKYCAIVILAFMVGLLPYVDNYARIGGFLFGIMLSFIHVHYIPQHKCMEELTAWRNKNVPKNENVLKVLPRRLLGKIVLLVSGLLLLVVLFIFSFLWFYLDQEAWNGFSYLNCIFPASVSNICLDYRQSIS